jgi:uncharacterized ferredoxin-like protein
MEEYVKKSEFKELQEQVEELTKLLDYVYSLVSKAESKRRANLVAEKTGHIVGCECLQCGRTVISE